MNQGWFQRNNIRLGTKLNLRLLQEAIHARSGACISKRNCATTLSLILLIKPRYGFCDNSIKKAIATKKRYTFDKEHLACVFCI